MFYPIILALLTIMPFFIQANQPSASTNQSKKYSAIKHRIQQKPYLVAGAVATTGVTTYLFIDTIKNLKNVNHKQPGFFKAICAESALTLAFGITAGYYINKLVSQANKTNKGN